MIKIKILEYVQQDGKTYITLMWDDGTVLPYKFEGYIPKEIAVHDCYIIGQHMPRQQFTGEIPTTAEDWEPNPVATKLLIKDWQNMIGDVYDQYGAEMEVSPTWSIQGTGARIENGKIVESEVVEDTSYFIVAKIGDLEERQERTIYAPAEEISDSEDAPVSRAEYEELKAELEAMLGGGI